MASIKSFILVLLVTVALTSRMSEATSKPPVKPDYCKKVFNVAARPTNDSFLSVAGTWQRGSAYSFGVGLFLPPYNDADKVGNIYGQANVMDLNGDPSTNPAGYVIAFANFNAISPVGQLSAQGVWIEKLNATSSFAVVGGTGVYAAATGSMDMIVAAKQFYLFTVRLAKDSC